jgi:hypothetical protein
MYDCGIYDPVRRNFYFCQNADFRLFDNPVRMDGQFYRGLNRSSPKEVFL